MPAVRRSRGSNKEGVSVAGITRWALGHKRLVVGFWLVLTVLGMTFSKKATDALSPRNTRFPVIRVMW
jgi:hypothetical protein